MPHGEEEEGEAVAVEFFFGFFVVVVRQREQVVEVERLPQRRGVEERLEPLACVWNLLGELDDVPRGRPAGARACLVSEGVRLRVLTALRVRLLRQMRLLRWLSLDDSRPVARRRRRSLLRLNRRRRRAAFFRDGGVRDRARA